MHQISAQLYRTFGGLVKNIIDLPYFSTLLILIIVSITNLSTEHAARCLTLVITEESSLVFC